MNERMTVGSLYPTATPTNVVHSKRTSSVSGQSAKPFNEILQEQAVKLSGHAAKRLEQRGIELRTEQMDQINSALDKAAAKGAKESLILMNNVALIVNVQNRTVVTALDEQSMKNNVFTQIDSAVIIS
ncbi:MULTISPECIES: TIGR02530 family flagellar biosynthesis protein [Paenibacillus]|uniref:TIGR02530 family flagellar biosynthesis protein n=1 Tax=Paenibacillus TaxID=44249 RepID=UPI000399E40B|nr:TIGR02530 family flagellar biosynthesis protein [Paenibacillus massiliensis]